MALIFIPKLNIKYLLFLGFIIFSFLFDVLLINIQNLAGDDIKNYDSTKLINYFIEQRYFNIICNLISDLLVGNFLLITLIRSKTKCTKLENNYENSQNQLKSLIYNDYKNSFWNKFKIIIIISTIDMICQFTFLLFAIVFLEDYLIEQRKPLLFVDIVSRYIFSLIIFKSHFYPHHKLSIILNLVGLVLFSYYDKNKIKSYFKSHSTISNIFYMSFIIIRYLLYSLEDVINKVAMIRENLKPYEIIFYKGVCQIFYLLLISILVYYKTDTFNYVLTIEHLPQRIIIRLFLIILNIGRRLFLIYVNDKFSPQHISILKIFQSFFISLFLLINKWIFQYIRQTDGDNWRENLAVFSAYFIMGISSLIYNELIIINCFGLEKSTKYTLDTQVEEDLRESLA